MCSFGLLGSVHPNAFLPKEMGLPAVVRQYFPQTPSPFTYYNQYVMFSLCPFHLQFALFGDLSALLLLFGKL